MSKHVIEDVIRPAIGYLVGVFGMLSHKLSLMLGMTTGDFHQGIDGWLGTATQVGGLIVVLTTGWIQLIKAWRMHRKLREEQRVQPYGDED
jgi:hypothetical protein